MCLIGRPDRVADADWSGPAGSRARTQQLGGAEVGMAAPLPNADVPCCAHSGATTGARQTMDEMDFERGEAGAEPGAVALGHREPVRA